MGEASALLLKYDRLPLQAGMMPARRGDALCGRGFSPGLAAEAQFDAVAGVRVVVLVHEHAGYDLGSDAARGVQLGAPIHVHADGVSPWAPIRSVSASS